jgi:hypothetical protein
MDDGAATWLTGDVRAALAAAREAAIHASSSRYAGRGISHDTAGTCRVAKPSRA